MCQNPLTVVSVWVGQKKNLHLILEGRNEAVVNVVRFRDGHLQKGPVHVLMIILLTKGGPTFMTTGNWLHRGKDSVRPLEFPEILSQQLSRLCFPGFSYQAGTPGLCNLSTFCFWVPSKIVQCPIPAINPFSQNIPDYCASLDTQDKGWDAGRTGLHRPYPSC